jgi:RND family efflux transporter MFP subunit
LAQGVLALLCTVAPAVAGTVHGVAGPFQLDLTITPDPPAVGANAVAVTVRGSDGKPVEKAAVTVTAAMTTMNMGATPFSAVPAETPGDYRAKVDLSMAGSWALDVRVAAGGREGRTSFGLTTGQALHQTSAAGTRAVWLWLAVMLLAPVLVLLIPARVLSHDQRTTLAGVVVLVAAVFLARAVIHAYKKPGQMTVIEAQAMDMSAMKPPTGLVPVVVEAARLEAFQGGVTYNGSVVPLNQQDVYPRVTGLIVDMPVYPGDHVKTGQVVARLDSRELGSRQNEAVLAHLAAQDAAGAARQEARGAQSAVDQAEADYTMAQRRIEQMNAERSSAQAMVRKSRSELVSAQAKVKEAQSSVEAARATQRSRAAMTDENRSMVKGAQADQTTGGAMTTEAKAMLNAAEREVAEADNMAAAAQAGLERAQADSNAMQAELPQAEADVRDMQADLTLENQQLDRMTTLLKQGAVSQEEYDKEKAVHDQAAAKVAKAEAMVTGTRRKITSAAAMARQAGLELAAAGERRAKADAMLGAARAKVAQAESEVTSRGAMVGQRETGVRRGQAEEDEAASMVAMRQADVETMQADVESARAAIDQAQQDVTKAEAGIAEMRAERDRASGMIREKRAMADATGQRASESARRAEQARAAAFTAGTIAGYTEIRATLDGVVTERVTSPATLVQPGTLLMRVAQIDQVRLQANVAEEDAAQIHVGAPVEAVGRKTPGRHDTTLVSAVFPAANPGSRTQLVEAIIDNRDGAYLPGDFVSLRLATGDATSSVLSVPSRAIVQTVVTGGAVNAVNQAAVWLVDAASGDTAHRVSVGIGRTNADRAEVLSGLKAGDRVIVSGFDNLHDGDRVRVTENADESTAAAPTSLGGRDRTPHGEAARAAATDASVPPPALRGAPSPTERAAPRPSAAHAAATPPPAAPATAAPAKASPSALAKQLWTCIMHPEVISDHPGKCPKCGMDLVPKK